jgi:hypothetical protein
MAASISETSVGFYDLHRAAFHKTVIFVRRTSY